MPDIESVRFQNDEFKALENIYLNEFHVTKESYPQKFDILCYPYKGNKAEYQIKIMFEFTNNYPKGPLKYEVEPVTGLTRDNVVSITNTIEEIIYNNRDRPIVYDIVEQIRLWIEQYLVEGKAYKTEQQLVAKVEEHFERPKFAAFTPVTLESFMAWKKEFDFKNKLKKVVEKKEGEEKMTGKEWFLGRKDEEEQEEEEEDSDEDYEEEEDEEDEKEMQIRRQKMEDEEIEKMFG